MYKDVDAIWCHQGGGAANQILNLLDYDAIKENPKPFLGMSDIDVLLLAINKETGLITFNTPDSKKGRNLDLDFDYSKENFIKRMFNCDKEIVKNSEWKNVREGKVKGKILGCNITSILKLHGTEFFPDFEDSILFLEAYKTNPMEVQWQLEKLKQIGIFEKIRGIVIGYMYSFQNNEERKNRNIDVDFEDMVLEATKEYNFPILKMNEFGHQCQNAFLPIGIEVEMDTDEKILRIIENFLE